MAEKIKQSTQWPWRLFLFSLLVLATTVFLYLGLDIGYKTFLNNQIQKKDQAITDLSQTISQEEQEQFLNFYSQLANLKVLLDNHVLTSRIFPLLESNTNKLVRYDFLDLDINKQKLILEGAAASYEVLAQQLEAFDNAPEITRVMISESQQDKGIVRFRLSLFLKPDLFKQL